MDENRLVILQVTLFPEISRDKLKEIAFNDNRKTMRQKLIEIIDEAYDAKYKPKK